MRQTAKSVERVEVESVGWPAIEMKVKMWPRGGGQHGEAPLQDWSLRLAPTEVAKLVKALGRDHLAWGESELSWALAKGEVPAGPAAAFRSVCELTEALMERSCGAAGLSGTAACDPNAISRERRWGPEGASEREASLVTLSIGLRPDHNRSQGAGWESKAGSELLARLESALAEFGAIAVKSPGAPKSKRRRSGGKPAEAESGEKAGGCCFLEFEREALACWVRPQEWGRVKRENAWVRALGGSDWAVAVALRCSSPMGELGNASSWSFSSAPDQHWALCSSGCDWDCSEATYQARLAEFFGAEAVSAPERLALGEDYGPRRDAMREWARRAPARCGAEQEAKEIESQTRPTAEPGGLKGRWRGV